MEVSKEDSMIFSIRGSSSDIHAAFRSKAVEVAEGVGVGVEPGVLSERSKEEKRIESISGLPSIVSMSS